MALVKRHKAIVLASGGMDSTLTAAFAFKKYDLAFLHVNYGQRTEKRELKAFKDVADYYGVKERLIVDIGYLKKIGGSSLTDKKISVSKADLKNKKVPSSYVPFRNANLLAIAASWAEVIGARSIFIGAVEEDSSGYPDCRKKFFESYEKMISLGTKPGTRIKIETPIINFSKKDIVEYSFKMKAPLHLTWSCYKGEDKACGVCDSCALRLRGFQMAGKEDPIPYKKILKY
ncbi:MAG: 7-cyano-7-deazaguanine synthase QueC [Bacteroidetes bacterium]|nr:7-cyano-7-deazaguanine synthase QueC [Bacteroidota bacterium]